MKNPFKFNGFDALIPVGMSIFGSVELRKDSITVIDGSVVGGNIQGDGLDEVLIVNGVVDVDTVFVGNLTVTGKLKCKTLVVSNQLAVNNTGEICAETIRYGALAIAAKATISGNLRQIVPET